MKLRTSCVKALLPVLAEAYARDPSRDLAEALFELLTTARVRGLELDAQRAEEIAGGRPPTPAKPPPRRVYAA